MGGWWFELWTQYPGPVVPLAMFQIFAVAILKMHKYGKSLIVIFISAFLRTNSGPDIMVSEVSVSCATVRTSTVVLDKPSSERAEDSAMREVVCAANQPRHLFTEFVRKVRYPPSPVYGFFHPKELNWLGDAPFTDGFRKKISGTLPKLTFQSPRLSHSQLPSKLIKQ